MPAHGPDPAPQPPSEASSLQELARQALRDLILAGRLAPGDLIKVISMEEGGSAPAQAQDFVIRITGEDQP